MIISSQFDGGNIECLESSDPGGVLLNIRSDNESEFYQWFYFRAADVRDLDCRYVITNAAGAAYQKGWQDYSAVASYDREFWFRVETRFDGENLVIDHLELPQAGHDTGRPQGQKGRHQHQTPLQGVAPMKTIRSRSAGVIPSLRTASS